MPAKVAVRADVVRRAVSVRISSRVQLPRRLRPVPLRELQLHIAQVLALYTVLADPLPARLFCNAAIFLSAEPTEGLVEASRFQADDRGRVSQ